MAETPFKIAIPDARLHLLKQKLDLTILPDELDDASWDYGVPLSDICRLLAYWKGGYDWRHHERQINEELPQFTRDIDVEGFGTLNIHYVHQRSEVDGAIPLFFSHGWPGSFLEVCKILPLLVEGSKDYPAFHVVAVSLPGFTFSEAPKKKGFGADQYAEVGHKLMLALGYDQYVTQGGDWGHRVTRNMAHNYGPKHARAWHTNLPIALPPTLLRSPLTYISDHLNLFGYSPMEKAALARADCCYFVQQATAPQTLGYNLADSPVGLLAWVYEKLVGYSDGYEWGDDEVLTWISVYWFSRAGPAASVRIYYEISQTGEPFKAMVPVKIPMGYSFFPKEIVGFPRRWLKNPYLVFQSGHTSGGHFASTEKPNELVGDLRRMFGVGGPAFGVVPGKTGYVSSA